MQKHMYVYLINSRWHIFIYIKMIIFWQHNVQLIVCCQLHSYQITESLSQCTRWEPLVYTYSTIGCFHVCIFQLNWSTTACGMSGNNISWLPHGVYKRTFSPVWQEKHFAATGTENPPSHYWETSAHWEVDLKNREENEKRVAREWKMFRMKATIFVSCVLGVYGMWTETVILSVSIWGWFVHEKNLVWWSQRPVERDVLSSTLEWHMEHKTLFEQQHRLLSTL